MRLRTKLYVLLVIVIFALFWALPAFAQDTTEEPTPTIQAPVETPEPDVTPAPEPVTSTVQSFLLTAAVFGGLAVLTFVFWQQGKNLKVVAGTVPPELAQLAFRVAMQQAGTTVEAYDDEALKTLATALGYDVIPDGNGGYIIKASPVAVAQNVEAAKDAYLRSGDR
jgi:hypothetical protein